MDILKHTWRIAADLGINGGNLYYNVPLKLLSSNAITNPISSIIAGGALVGITGKLAKEIGLIGTDPLIEESDPSKLQRDEVIVILKIDDNRGAENNIAMDIHQKEISELTQEFPDKFVVMNISPTADSTINFPDNKKIKKIIIVSHGNAGTISNDGKRNYQLTDVAAMIQKTGMPKHFSKKPEIHFTACNLAQSEKGKAAVRDFAETILPTGGTVKANNILGLAGISNNIFDLHPSGAMATTILSRMSSINEEESPWVTMTSSSTYTYEKKPPP